MELFLRVSLGPATPTGLEPATSAVTGRRSNQLSYGAKCEIWLANLTRIRCDGGLLHSALPFLPSIEEA